MDSVQLPPEILARLEGSRSQVPVCDETGRVRGYFVTTAQIYEWAKELLDAQPMPTLERTPENGLSTCEAIQYLRTVETRHRAGE